MQSWVPLHVLHQQSIFLAVTLQLLIDGLQSWGRRGREPPARGKKKVQEAERWVKTCRRWMVFAESESSWRAEEWRSSVLDTDDRSSARSRRKRVSVLRAS